MEITAEQKKQLDIENKKIAENIHKIKHRIVVFSGKGGVGKTTVSVNLAYGLYRAGHKAGLLDADVTGPNVPKMVGLVDQPQTADKKIIPVNHLGIKVISLANMMTAGQPVIWRGPMRSKLLSQFLRDVEWGMLDFLIGDLPPGTGDEIITMTQKMEPELAIIVTTPQELSLIDSAKAINMANRMEIPNIGIIENMSGFICPYCGNSIDLYGEGGGRRQARDLGVHFLGALPLNPETIPLADQGKPVIMEKPDADISLALMDVIGRILELTDIS